jgi:predicted secreted hydrolase
MSDLGMRLRGYISVSVVLVFLCSLRSGAQEYRTAEPGYRFSFPADFFNHEEYQTEWWYYTGNLRAANGHRFGFELTFFRQGIDREKKAGVWHVNDVWMAHLALSDAGAQRFLHEERLNRSGPGLAGVDAQRGVVWNGNWSARIGGSDADLRGVAEAFGLQLHLAYAKPPVVQGQDGVSRKAEGMGHASHYFSQTRLATKGTIEVGGKTYTVEGTSWMDHEFFTGSMAENETGWDWLSVQLEDGTELMLYRLRHGDGSIDPYSSGSFVDKNGKGEFLASRDFEMVPAGDNWTSDKTKASYPLRWRVTVPRLQLELDVTTPLRAQELTARFGPSYWEGAMDVQGTRGGAAAKGVGYLEMTGYAPGGEPVISR